MPLVVLAQRLVLIEVVTHGYHMERVERLKSDSLWLLSSILLFLTTK